MNFYSLITFDMQRLLPFFTTIVPLVSSLLLPHLLQASGGGCSGNAKFDYCESLRELGVQFQFQGYSFLGWDFGDGTFDWENENPYHVFEEEGIYYICAFGAGSHDNGYCWVTECEFIEVNHSNSIEVLEGEINYVAEGNQFHFETTADIEGKTVYWSFGNEGISADKSPMHIFEKPGTHEVVFTSIDVETCTEKSIIKEIELPSDLGVCEVRFDLEMEENKVEFTSRNIGYPTQVLWDFGNGETSTELHPSHTFTDTRTSKEVCLTVIDAYQGCEKTHCKTINFEKKGLCKAKFEAIPLQDSLFYFLNDVSEYEGEIVNRRFFDKNNYYQNGRMPYHVSSLLYRINIAYGAYRTICLEIELENGMKDVYCQTIFFPQKYNSNKHDFAGYFTAKINQNNPNEVYFNSVNYGDFAWDYGDGRSDTVGRNVYEDKGIYQVCMRAIEDLNSLNYCRLIDVGSENEVKASFNAWEKENEFTFRFEDGSVSSENTNIVKWNWDFGDGTFSTLQNPIHVFDTPNTHQICLAVENHQGKSDTYCKEISIEGCRASFTIESLNETEEKCMINGESYVLIDNSFSNTEITELHWITREFTSGIGWSDPDTIGDSSSTSIEYTAKENNTVFLSIVDELGCTSTYSKRTSYGCDDCRPSYYVSTNHSYSSERYYSISVFFHDYSEVEDTYAFFLYPNFFKDWTWIFEDGTTSKAAKLTKQFDGEGPHKICLKATQNGDTCTYCQYVEGRDFVSVEEDEATDIEEIGEGLKWKIYPNPSTNYLNIDLPSEGKIVQQLLVQDWQGKVVYQERNVKQGVSQIDTSLFPKGLYFINLITDSGFSSKKFLKVED